MPQMSPILWIFLANFMMIIYTNIKVIKNNSFSSYASKNQIISKEKKIIKW